MWVRRGRYYACRLNTSKGLYMKKLLPLEGFSSLGRVQSVGVIIAAASISFLPFSSAFANHSGGGGGGHAGGGGGHASGGAHASGGGHAGYSRPAASSHSGGFKGAGFRTAGRNVSHASYHANLYARKRLLRTFSVRAPQLPTGIKLRLTSATTRV